MDVRRYIPGKVKVDHVVHAVEINTAGGTRLYVASARGFAAGRGLSPRLLQMMFIGGYNDVVGALVELTDCVDANVGRQLRVQNAGTDAELL